MTGPKGNIESCFPKTLNVSRGGAEVNIELQRNRLLYASWLINLLRFQGA